MKMIVLALLFALLFIAVVVTAAGATVRIGLRTGHIDCDDVAMLYGGFSSVLGIPHDIRYGYNDTTAHVWIQANTIPSLTVFEISSGWTYTDTITYYRLWQFIRSDYGYKIPDLQEENQEVANEER